MKITEAVSQAANQLHIPEQQVWLTLAILWPTITQLRRTIGITHRHYQSIINAIPQRVAEKKN